TVRTPVGTIGIRGTSVGGNIDPTGGGSTISLLADPRGLPSAVQFTNAAGTQYMTEPNTSVAVASFFSAPSTPFASNPLQLGTFQSLLGDVLPQTQQDVVQTAQIGGTSSSNRPAGAVGGGPGGDAGAGGPAISVGGGGPGSFIGGPAGLG